MSKIVFLCLVDNVTVTISPCKNWEEKARHCASVSYNRDFTKAEVTLLQKRKPNQQ